RRHLWPGRAVVIGEPRSGKPSPSHGFTLWEWARRACRRTRWHALSPLRIQLRPSRMRRQFPYESLWTASQVKSTAPEDRVIQAELPTRSIGPGTPMVKVIPPRLVEPYLTGQRSVIAGYVYRVSDCTFRTPADYYQALALGYEGSEFSANMAE